MKAPLLLAAWLLAVPCRAADDASFAEGLAEARDALPVAATSETVARRKAVERFSRLIADMLSWYGRAEAQPGTGAEELSRKVAQGLRSGAYDSLVLGESHSDPLEIEAGVALVRAVLESGAPVGAFLQEAAEVRTGDGTLTDPAGIFKQPGLLAAAGVPVLLMKSQFQPERDVLAGLGASGPKLLVTYSGSAHTSERARDLIVKSLKIRDLGWGSIVPGRPVIEQALRRKRRKPLIVSMIREAQVLGAVEEAVVAEASDGVTLERWRSDLAAAHCSDLDRAYLKRWAADLGVSELLGKALGGKA